jgi:hypothetical protein
MPAATFSANAVAREASKAIGRTVTAKQVRGIARATIKRFDKVAHPEYQAHAYTAAERTALIATMRKRAGRATVAPKPASKPRAARKPRIAPVVAPDA